MCTKCGNNSCSSGNKCRSKSAGADLASLQNEMSEIRSILDEIDAKTRFLNCNPILIITDPDNIALFDSETGLGSGCWEGWAICNGVTQTKPGTTNKTITPPNLLDRFVVGAGDTYDVGDTGGENTHVLTVAEIPAHEHEIIDPGHNHPIDDDMHSHGITEEPHNHSFTGVEHDHTLSIDSAGAHDHSTGFRIIGDGNGGENFNVREANANAGAAVSTDGAHVHTGTVGVTTAGGNVGDASTNISVQNAATGIEVTDNTTNISMEEVGGGEAHENRPPFYAVIFIMKL